MGLTADNFRTTGTWKGSGAGRLSHETKLTPWQYILLVSILALIYVGLAKLGHSFTVPGSDTAFIWPPAGYATAVLYLFGLRFIPAVSLGCYLAGAILYQLSPSALLMLTGISTFEPIIAVLLLRWMDFDPSMGRVRDGVALIVSAGIISSMCAATFGTMLFSADGQLDFSLFWQNWLVFWIANSSANMSLTPLLLTWASPAGVLSRKLKTKVFAKLELGLQVAVAVGISSLALKGEKQFGLELEYMLFPVLTWAGLRFGPRASSTVIVAATAVSLLLTTRSLVGSSEQAIYAQLLSIQMFLTVFAITGHLLGGAAEERARTQSQLSQARDNLELTVTKRTGDVVQTKKFLEAVLENVSSAIIAVDATGALTQFNRSARKLYNGLENYKGSGTWADDFRLYRTDGTSLPEDEVPLRKALSGSAVQNVELVTKPDDTTLHYLLASSETIRNSDGTVAGAVVVAHDITEQKQAENLQRLFSRATVTANEAPDTEQAVLSILEIICTYTGWPIGHALKVENNKGVETAVSTNWWFVAADNDVPRFKQDSVQTFVSGDDVPGKVLASRTAKWIEVSRESTLHRLRKIGLPTVITALAFPVMADSRLVAILEFFSFRHIEPDARLRETIEFVCAQLGRVYERQLSTQRLMSMTLRDPLTEMPNRLAFQDILRQAIAHARRRQNYSFAVLFIDLDRFKIINDSLGHAAGDQVIVEVANRIQSCLREGDAMARLGGDEFTVLLDDLGERTDGANAIKVAQRIEEEIERPIAIKNEKVHVSASVGIVLSAAHYTDPDMMLRDADSAMYRAKEAGRARVEMFSPQTHNKVMCQLRLENDLRRALEQNEFQLYYQPIISLSTGDVTGFEALIRWNSPERGLVPPSEFIPLCEETGLIVPLGTWVIREACRWISGINQSEVGDTAPITVSVNVSGVQLSRGAVVGPVQVALANGLLKPHQLHLEIVESTLVQNPVQAVFAFEALRKMGVQIMIDDFGTGYSSLSYLARLPIDALKIDQSFVRDMSRNENSAEVVRCIISMADALRLSVVAEGVETREQADVLKRMGCALAQGYHYSKPLPGDIAAELALKSLRSRMRLT